MPLHRKTIQSRVQFRLGAGMPGTGDKHVGYPHKRSPVPGIPCSAL
ncbi:MAG: hypothetical protein R3E79_36580 [Caldilineaceae bacterium]